MSDPADTSSAVAAHVLTILLPVFGPLAVVIGARRNPFTAWHARSALAWSAGWVATASAVMSLDQGRVTVDESGLSGAGTVMLVMLLVLIVAKAAIDARRAHAGAPPLATAFRGR